ncbi:MAG: sugar transferase [Maribacter sp.]|nr:sugar transferase [Maribacter sp.]
MNLFKPFADFLISLCCLILLLPIFMIIFIIVLIDNKGQAFFFQNRAGKDGKVFRIIKIKTMNDKKDKQGNLLSYKERVTSLGKFLRKYSLDEIPQLYNVIQGDMSLVGPRPLHTKYLSEYDKEQARRQNVKGGITGWAQINGRNTISWEQKFKYDVWYVDNLSFLLDLKILWSTFIKVVKKEDINNTKDLSMPPFKGVKRR